MKRFLVILLVASSGILKASPLAPYPAAASEWMYIEPFREISTAADPALDQNHAQFELQFDDMVLAGQPLAVRPVRIELSCNGVIRRFALDSTMKITIDVSPGTYQFMAIAEGNSNYTYNEITSEPILILPGFKTVIGVHMQPVIVIDNDALAPVMVFKPVIYLYPEKDLAVDVQLRPAGEFTFTYPPYNSGWKGTAHPDGSMTIGRMRYPYLFWEATQDDILQLADYSTGFIVKKEEITTFLNNALSAMGFSDKEKTDFITFWGPRMARSEQGFAHFLFTEDYDRIATLEIQPKPQNVFRLYLLWTPLAADVQLQPKRQTLKGIDKNGFSVVEWGGSELPILTEQPIIN